MLRVVAANILDAEVVDDKARGMGPEAWGASGGGIAELGEMFLELLVSNEPRLFQAVHAATDIGVEPSISCGDIVEVVLGDDLVGDGILYHLYMTWNAIDAENGPGRIHSWGRSSGVGFQRMFQMSSHLLRTSRKQQPTA